MALEPGTRVGAVLEADETKVRMFGWGTYLGDGYLPPPNVSQLFARLGLKTVKIKLDNGEIVWGFECWWGEEKALRKWIGDREIEIVSVRAVRQGELVAV